jgi:hypothetical protein
VLRIEHRQTVFENRVLRKIFGPKSGAGGVIRSFMSCTAHPIFFRLSNQEKWNVRDVWSSYEEENRIQEFLWRSVKEKRLVGRPRRRWKDNITTDPKEIEWEIVVRIHVAQVEDTWWHLTR